MLDLNDISLFVHVVRAGSFAESARRLGIPPNTVSRRVQQLEQHLNVRLMQRSTRRLTLTDAGTTFYQQCADQVESLTHSVQELVDGSRLPSGRMRIAAPANFFDTFPITWISEFLDLYPLVRIEFVLNDERADLLGEGIDLAFRAGYSLEPHLVARQIAMTRTSLVASPAYLAKYGMPQTIEALMEHHCLTLPKSSGHQPWRLEGPEGLMEIDVSGPFSANTSQARLKATLTGLGIAFLPMLMTSAYVAAGALREVLPQYGMNGVGMYFVYLSRRQLPRAVSTFIEFATEKMRTLEASVGGACSGAARVAASEISVIS